MRASLILMMFCLSTAAAAAESKIPAPAQPGSASAVVEQASKRIRSVTIYGDDVCPAAANDDEIIVCARQPEEERFRLPPATREKATQSRRNNAWVARVGEMADAGRNDKCTAVGNGDHTGCTIQKIERAAAERDAAKSRDGEASAAAR